MTKFAVGIIGMGFVGSAMYQSFVKKDLLARRFDKYVKNDDFDNFSTIICSDVIFLCLPTIYDEKSEQYDLGPIEENLSLLKINDFTGPIVIKSTVCPGTCEKLAANYSLNIVHNPEFLTAKTAAFDFHNQSHVVLGKTSNCDSIMYEKVVSFYQTCYSNATVSKCSAIESESMKLFCNSFYAVKIQFFNELYLLCKKVGMDYNVVKDLMLKNGWINKMHTNVPGPDGLLSYGGLCFPKDTSALLSFMKENDTASKVLAAVVLERNEMREDKDNIK
jgi:nucleotide sugar dehydrogenase